MRKKKKMNDIIDGRIINGSRIGVKDGCLFGRVENNESKIGRNIRMNVYLDA